MEPDPDRPSRRGRGRGRAIVTLESSASDPNQGASSQQPSTSTDMGMQRDAYMQMFQEEPKGGNGSRSSSSSDNTSGSRTGRGDSEPGSLDRGNIPRGSAAEGRREFVMPDYVVSRPHQYDKCGTSGDTTIVIANYYQFQPLPNFKMCLYAVKLEPQPEYEVEKIIRKLIQGRRDMIGSYLLSGFQLFTTRLIEDQDEEFLGALPDAPTVTYKVKLEFKRILGNGEGLVFQFHNIMIRQMQNLMSYKQLGRHYFDPCQRVEFPSWKMEFWPGFLNSIRQQESGLMLNIEPTWKVLRNESILNKIGQIRNKKPPNFETSCNEALVGMTVITKYNARAYKISRIDFNSSPNSSFVTKDGPITYIEYYREKYGVEIVDAEQPMLVSEPKLRDIRRGQANDIYLVPELCYPCGLTQEMRDNVKLMKDVAKCLHMTPDQRLQTMEKFISGISNSEQIKNVLKAWGVKIQPEPVQIQARTLPLEEITCGNGKRAKPDEKADWTLAFRYQRMLASENLVNWAIIVSARDNHGVGSLVSMMQKVATPLGYHIASPKVTIRVSTPSTRDSFVKGVNDAVAELNGKVDMLLVVLPTNNADTYAAVKQRCSIDYGIPSQCFLAKNVNNRGLMSICTKLVIQMNAKQGGEPWGVVVPIKNVMVIGYDVHHAGAGGGGMSVGAMTATVSATLGTYYSTTMKLRPRHEVDTGVAGMFEKCLNAYIEKTQTLPAKLMIYRDGVGEGQLRIVYEQELESFKTKIKQKYGEKGTPLPKLTYIVVNKKLHSRFFLQSGRNLYSNPKPGLVVDDVVTRPERYDFFLISQTARQGCVGPTYYNVLFDESGLPPDRLQKFTFKLCHLYFNWTGTVAVPGPVQNANKLAYLVGTALKRPANHSLSYLLHFL